MTDAAALFVDTSFWIALLNRRDEHHARAVRWKSFIAATKTRLVTSEADLWEWLNASGSPLLRGRAAQGYRRCHVDAQISVWASTTNSSDRRWSSMNNGPTKNGV